MLTVSVDGSGIESFYIRPSKQVARFDMGVGISPQRKINNFIRKKLDLAFNPKSLFCVSNCKHNFKGLF